MKRRAWIWLLLALALLVRGAVPQGFMLAAVDGDSSLPKVLICTAAGSQLLALTLDGQPAEPGQQNAVDKSPCVFGVASVALLAEQSSGVPAERVGQPREPRRQVMRAEATARHAWRARAPPVAAAI